MNFCLLPERGATWLYHLMCVLPGCTLNFIIANYHGLMLLLKLFRLKFPSIFIVYGTIAIGTFEFSVLVGYIDRKTLLCTTRDLMQSIDNPTPFCRFQGKHNKFSKCVYTPYPGLHPDFISQPCEIKSGWRPGYEVK